MNAITSHIGDLGDFDVEIWGDMFYFDDYYSLAEKDILAWEGFDSAFFAYLNDGIPLDSEKIWRYDKCDKKYRFLKKSNVFSESE